MSLLPSPLPSCSLPESRRASGSAGSRVAFTTIFFFSAPHLLTKPPTLPPALRAKQVSYICRATFCAPKEPRSSGHCDVDKPGRNVGLGLPGGGVPAPTTSLKARRRICSAAAHARCRLSGRGRRMEGRRDCEGGGGLATQMAAPARLLFCGRSLLSPGLVSGVHTPRDWIAHGAPRNPP